MLSGFYSLSYFGNSFGAGVVRFGHYFAGAASARGALTPGWRTEWRFHSEKPGKAYVKSSASIDPDRRLVYPAVWLRLGKAHAGGFHYFTKNAKAEMALTRFGRACLLTCWGRFRRR